MHLRAWKREVVIGFQPFLRFWPLHTVGPGVVETLLVSTLLEILEHTEQIWRNAAEATAVSTLLEILEHTEQIWRNAAEATAVSTLLEILEVAHPHTGHIPISISFNPS